MCFEGFESAEAILNELMAGKQKRLGKKVKNFDIERWLDIARWVVYEANYAKFTQHKILIEKADYDDYLGEGMDGKGQNMLGKILIEIRDEIKVNGLDGASIRYDKILQNLFHPPV